VLQEAGRSSTLLPGHSSHSPQVLPQAALGVQRGQLAVSSTFSRLQDSPMNTLTLLESASCTVQHPKQSQPLGVRAAQKS
jgi:hypothetical protein